MIHNPQLKGKVPLHVARRRDFGGAAEEMLTGGRAGCTAALATTSYAAFRCVLRPWLGCVHFGTAELYQKSPANPLRLLHAVSIAYALDISAPKIWCFSVRNHGQPGT